MNPEQKAKLLIEGFNLASKGHSPDFFSPHTINDGSPFPIGDGNMSPHQKAFDVATAGTNIVSEVVERGKFIRLNTGDPDCYVEISSFEYVESDPPNVLNFTSGGAGDLPDRDGVTVFSVHHSHGVELKMYYDNFLDIGAGIYECLTSGHHAPRFTPNS